MLLVFWWGKRLMWDSLWKTPAQCIVSLGGGLLLLAALAGAFVRAAELSPAEYSPPGQRLREGTTLSDQLGRFTIRGERVICWLEETEQTYCCLENLALARIYKAVTETPDELQWVVSGTITEYNNVNYLLITRAIRKTQPATPR